MKYLIFNLKSKLKYLDIIEYANELSNIKNNIIICPSNIYLEYFHNLNFNICAQDVSRYPIGNYTGETSASALKSIGCSYALVGHYERRLYFKENKEDFIYKTKQAYYNNIRVIYCVGENKFDDEEIFLQRQIKELFDNLTKNEINNIIIAYEPTWLIGKNDKIDIKRINDNVLMLKEYINKTYDVNIEIIYGGSVNSNNMSLLKRLPIDGLLIGDSSTSTKEIFTLNQEFKQ